MIACTNDHKSAVGLYTLFTLQQMFLKIENFFILQTFIV